MPKYKLSYLNLRARGEVVRYLFALADVEFEDFRVTTQEWAKLKLTSKAPFSQLPILEFDDKVLCQRDAICEYLAMEFGAADDMFQVLVKAFKETDQAKKAEYTAEFYQFVPKWLNALEKILLESGGRHFVDDRLTLADIMIFYTFECIMGNDESILNKTPALNDLYKRIASNPRMVAWKQKRPKTDY